MSEYLYAGLTSQTLDVMLYNSSTGTAYTGLVYNTSGLKAYYRKGATGTMTAITLATQTVGGAFSSGGFVEIDSTNAQGLYRLDVPNAMVDTEGFVTLYIYGATNLSPCVLRVDCRPLPVDVKKVGGTSQTAGDLAALLATLAGYVDTEVAAIKAKTDNLPSDPADASDIASSFSTVNSTLATIAAYIDTEVAAIKAKTDNLPADPADASDIASSFSTVNSTLATIAGYLDTEIAAIKAKTDNLPSDPADASDISASFSTVNSTLATIAGYVDTEVASIKSTVDALATKLGGITLLKNWLGALAGKTADSSTLAEINATTAGAGFDNTTDSLEAIKDAGTGGGGGSGDASQTTLLEVQATVEDIAATLSGTPIEPTSRVASGGTITAYIGDDFRVRSDTELSISTSDVGGVLYTKWNAIGEENLYFGASREGSDAGAISGTVAAITSVGSGASQTVKLTVEITNCGSGLKPGTYEYQIEQRQTQGSETDSFVEISGTLELKRKVV